MCDDRTALKVLIIDDDKASRIISKYYLKKITSHVDVAISGAEGLNACQRQRYNLILVDIEMPEMNGYETVRKIRDWESAQGFPLTPVIALSGHNFHDIENEIAEVGLNGYLSKPFSINDLNAVIADLSLVSSLCADNSEQAEVKPNDSLPDILQSHEFPGIDINVGLKNSQHNTDTYLSVLKLFAAGYQDIKTDMLAASADKNIKAVKNTAHKIKSTACVVGASELARNAGIIEKRCSDGIELLNEQLEMFHGLLQEAFQSVSKILQYASNSKAESNIETLTDGEFDTAQVKPLIDSLMKLIEKNSIQAEAAAVELKRKYTWTPVQDKLKLLIEQLGQYSFKEAAITLNDIKSGC